MQKKSLFQISAYRRALFLIACWTVIVSGLALWHYSVRQQSLIQMAYVGALAYYTENVKFRNWSTSQGGVYVPVSPETRKNPYLAHLENRDIQTLDGRSLTLINPAYMARLVHEFTPKKVDSNIVHITSLNPIRPENRADFWEEKALRTLAGGESEVYSVAEYKGKPYFRFMRPMVTVQGCLKCHAFQGFELGDIRGGISISLPLEQFAEQLDPSVSILSAVYFCLWLIGIAAVLLLVRPLRQKIDVCEEGERHDPPVSVEKLDAVTCKAVQRIRLPLPWKSFFLRFIPLFLLASVILLTVFYLDSRKKQALLEQQQNQYVKSREEIISLDLQAIAGDLMVLSSFPELSAFLDSPESSKAREAMEKVFLAVSVNKGIYDQIRFLSADGQERIRIDYNKGMPAIVTADKLQNKKDRYYFADTISLAKLEIFVSPMDLNIERGKVEVPLKPMMRFGAPVYDQDNKKRGILLLNYLSEQLIYNLVRRYSLDTGKLMLVNSDGYWLKGIKTEQEWGFMFPERKNVTFAKENPTAWHRVTSQHSGQFYDEAGLFSFSTIFPLQESLKSSTGSPEAFEPSNKKIDAGEYQWKLVTLVDSAEVKLAMYGDGFKWIPPYLFMLLLLAISSWRLALTRQLRDAAAIELAARNQELEQSIQEIKRLQGILPICSFCKQIRDDKGYWQEVDSYINQHSEVQFSHGVCPACAEKHYPEYINKKGKG